jgi:hypothetical protein
MSDLPIMGIPSTAGPMRVSRSSNRQHERGRQFERSLAESDEDQGVESDDNMADAETASPARTLQGVIERRRRTSQDGEHLIDVMV